MDFTRDYYSDLGVLPDVSKEVIRAVYLALAKRFHPDSGGNQADQEKFKIIGEAYEVLSDPTSRKQYDDAIAPKGNSSFNSDVEDEADLQSSELEKEWSFALEYYPELEALRLEVAAVSSTLSIAFQSTLLSEKSFKTASELKKQTIDNYIERYFGENEKIKALALHLLLINEKVAAKELNKAVTRFGSSLEAGKVIQHITTKFGVTSFEGKTETFGDEHSVPSMSVHGNAKFRPIGFGLVLLAMILIGLFGRDMIIASWPPASQLYDAIGMGDPPLSELLDISGIKPTPGRDKDGKGILTITGNVVNISGEMQMVPQMAGALLDAKRAPVFEWTFKAPKSELKPGEKIEFSTLVPDPPKTAQGLKISFVDEDSN
jgi:curved DNA-binding protein CbpA